MNKFIQTTFILSILLSAPSFMAQTINANLEPIVRPKLLIRYSIFDHVHIKQPAAQLGAEIKINPDFGINLEFGKINERFNIFNLSPTMSAYQNKRTVNGERFAAELRYYLSPNGMLGNVFISFRQEFEGSTITREDKLIRFDGEFTQLFEMEIDNRTSTSILSFGFNIYETNNFSITLVNGLGIRHRILTSSSLPEDATRVVERGLLRDRLQDITYPMVHFGVYATWGFMR